MYLWILWNVWNVIIQSLLNFLVDSTMWRCSLFLFVFLFIYWGACIFTSNQSLWKLKKWLFIIWTVLVLKCPGQCSFWALYGIFLPCNGLHLKISHFNRQVIVVLLDYFYTLKVLSSLFDLYSSSIPLLMEHHSICVVLVGLWFFSFTYYSQYISKSYISPPLN